MISLKPIILQISGIGMLILSVALIKQIPNRASVVADICSASEAVKPERASITGKLVSYSRQGSNGSIELEQGGCTIRVLGNITKFIGIKSLDISKTNNIKVAGLLADGMLTLDSLQVIESVCGRLLSDKIIDEGAGKFSVWIQEPTRVEGYPTKFGITREVWSVVSGKPGPHMACAEAGMVTIAN